MIKNKIAILVGGTGLYFNTITKGISKIPDIDVKTRNKVRNLFKKLGFSSFYEKHGDRINFVPVFGVEVDSGDVLISNEHCEFKWVEFETALSHLVWNGQKKGINVINEMIISNDDRMKWSRIDLSNLVF